MMKRATKNEIHCVKKRNHLRSLVPVFLPLEPLCQSVHELNGPLIRAQIKETRVEVKVLEGLRVAGPAHRRVVETVDESIGGRLVEAIRHSLHVRVPVEKKNRQEEKKMRRRKWNRTHGVAHLRNQRRDEN
jgi:hypothetical protein